MKNYKWILCTIAVVVITGGFLFQGTKLLAEDIPYLDSKAENQISVYIQL